MNWKLFKLFPGGRMWSLELPDGRTIYQCAAGASPPELPTGYYNPNALARLKSIEPEQLKNPQAGSSS